MKHESIEVSGARNNVPNIWHVALTMLNAIEQYNYELLAQCYRYMAIERYNLVCLLVACISVQ